MKIRTAGEKRYEYCGVRRQRGAAIFLLFVIIIVAMACCLVSAGEILRYFVCRQKALAAVEGASLAAANDLSTIVIKDPNFGFVALGDYAPEGTALLADDGEPLPVHGINTIVGTARLDMLIAKQLNNQEFLRLAQIDAENAAAASARLTQALKAALTDKSPVAVDRNGDRVNPQERARKMIATYLHDCGLESKLKIASIQLSLGSLASGGGTITPLPVPLALAEMDKLKSAGGYYVAFQNMPVDDQSYYFTAVGKQSSLVPNQDFVPENGKIPASIVRVQVVFKMLEQQSSPLGDIKVAACGQPFSLADRANGGTLVFAMPDGAPPTLRSLSDFLSDRQLNRVRTPLYRAVGGDYPIDGMANVKPATDQNGIALRPTLANIFAQGIYDWLRTADCRPRIDAVASLIGNRLVQPAEGALPIYFIRVVESGNIETNCSRASQFSNQVVQEGEDYALAAGAIPSEALVWSLAFRDQVRDISLTSGKHGGQMMPLTLSPNGRSAPDANNDKAVRKSYVQGGLAVEFVISSPQLPAGAAN
jgi:hypothetical protein